MPDLQLEARMPDASNATFVGVLDAAAGPHRVIYKPIAGERPLWDFPDAVLAHREVATYAVSEALGWHLVPPTWLGAGPHGPGMLQTWIEQDDRSAVDVVAPGEQDPDQRVVLQARDETGRPVLLVHEDTAALRRVALLDVLVNNADRKGSHILTQGDRRWAIDHGLTFHTDPKLRTVLWGWLGAPLTDPERTAIAQALRDETLLQTLRTLLVQSEIDAFLERGCALLQAGTFPAPSGDWPAIPWPAL